MGELARYTPGMGGSAEDGDAKGVKKGVWSDGGMTEGPGSVSTVTLRE